MFTKFLFGISLLLVLSTEAVAEFKSAQLKFTGTQYDIKSLIPVKTYYLVGNHLKLRKEPTLKNDNIVTVLANGWKPISILEQQSQDGTGWSMIQTTSQEVGWILSKYIKHIDPKNTKKILSAFKQELKSVNSYDHVRKEKIYKFYTQFYLNGESESLKTLNKINEIYKQYENNDLVLALVSYDTPLLINPSKLNKHHKTIVIGQWYLNEGETNSTIIPFKSKLVFDKNTSFKSARRDVNAFGWCRMHFTGILSNKKVENIAHLSESDLNKIRALTPKEERYDYLEGGFYLHPRVQLAFITNDRTFVLIALESEDGSFYKLFELTAWNAKLIQTFNDFHEEQCMIK